jgi:hypothetical protein
MYFAHRDWDWATKTEPCGGRAKLPAVRAHGCVVPQRAHRSITSWLSAHACTVSQEHTEQVRAVLLDMTRAQQDILLTPNVCRSRHLLTSGGALPGCTA